MDESVVSMAKALGARLAALEVGPAREILLQLISAASPDQSTAGAQASSSLAPVASANQTVLAHLENATAVARLSKVQIPYERLISVRNCWRAWLLRCFDSSRVTFVLLGCRRDRCSWFAINCRETSPKRFVKS